MFRDREDAAHRLAEELGRLPLRDPLVLGIPRGGVAIGAGLARALGGDLDVVLSRKLRAPVQPELAIGAVCEDGSVYLDETICRVAGADERYIEQERLFQLAEIERRRALVRAVRPRAPMRGRSVIVTDDGIATGSTMIAALQTIPAAGPHEIIVAVPVGPSERLGEIRRRCTRLICLHEPETFWAIGQFYENFEPVEDDAVIGLLREFAGREPVPERS